MGTSWSGELKLSSSFRFPVKLEKAVSEEKIDTTTVCPECDDPTPLDWQGYKCPECGRDVSHHSQADRAKDVGQDVVKIDKKEMDAAKLSRSPHLDIKGLVDSSEVGFPRDSMDKAYWLTPKTSGKDQQNKVTKKCYGIMREMLGDKVAIGNIVFSNKEYIIGITHVSEDEMKELYEQMGEDPSEVPDGGSIMAQGLYYNEEIRTPSDYEVAEIGPDEKEMADKVKDELSAEIEWEDEKDRYKESLKDIIKKKVKGESVDVEEVEEETTSGDPMQMMKETVGE